jgi:hypothetical protein
MPVFMGDREARKGENESWFREVNERLEDRALAVEDSRFQVLCECAREECTERILLTIDEYEQVRSSPRSFVVVPGHADSSLERVVSEHDAYEVVEKFGDAGLVAQAEDIR